MINVVLTSNAYVIAEFDKCGVPRNKDFVPVEINGVKYLYQYYFKSGVYDVDDFIRKMKEMYSRIAKDDDRVFYDLSRYWDYIVAGEIAATYHYYVTE